ncbi:MAG: carboxypeptidase-like regulatory domain-containing protein [Terriglobales bacterium]
MISVLVLLVLVVFTQKIALAQGSADGSIRGSITDPSGASVSGVTVTVTNNSTGASKTQLTGDDGIFNAQNLAPALYTVKAEKSGFGTRLTQNVLVSVGKATTVDIQLAVGSVTDTVNVEANVAPVTDDKPDRGVVLGAQTLAELPLQVSGNIRLVDTFLTLAPGVTGDTFSARINGAPDFSQDFYYDGIPYMNADGGGRQEALGAPFESVDEYAIITNAYNAQYGRGAGLLNFHIRSGSNRLHGGGWEYLRNNVLDAKGFFATQAPTEKQNEFGFKLGGPVYIPKIYNGKDKTFFFTNFNWFRFRGGNSNSLTTLPTAAMKTGDFSSLVNTSINLGTNPCDGSTVFAGQIFDPNTTQVVGGQTCRTAFPGNIIPIGRLSPLSAQFLALMPTATTNAPINNTLVAVPTAPQNNLVYLFKVDHSINHAVTVHGSYYKGRYNTPTSPLISGPLGSGNNFNVLGWQPRASVDWTISPRLLNQTLYSVQYTEGVRIFFPLVPSGFTSAISTPGQPFPALAIQGMPSFGTGSDNGQNSGGCWPCTFFADNLKWAKGRHSLAFGTEMRWEDEKDSFATNIGTYTFGSAATSLQSSATPGELGFGFAGFFLGTPNGVSQTGHTPARLVKTGYRALYVQDDFRATKNLTINAGLRWDVSLPAWNSAGYFSTFDPTVPNPGAGGLLGSLVYAGNSGVGGCTTAGGSSLCRAKIANTYYNNFQPRLGFAYRLGEKTVLRGGFGITTIRGGASTLMGPEIAANFLTGYQAQQTLTSPDNGFSVPIQIAPTWDVGIPAVGPPPARTLDAANGQPIDLMRPVDGKIGYTQMWNMTVERQLPFKIGFEASYVGSASVRVGANLLNPNQTPSQFLSLGNELNTIITSPADAAALPVPIPYPFPGFTGSVAQALRPFPQFQYISPTTQNTGHIHYNSLQLRAQKYFSNGLTFLVSYTYSQTISDATDQFSTFGAPPLDTADQKAEKRILGGTTFGNTYPRYLSAAATYELPIGPGKRFLPGGGVVGRIVGGWNVSFVGAYDAGTVLPITGGSQQPIFNGPARPNIVAGVDPKAFSGGKFNPFTDTYLNPAAFSDPGAFAIGDAPPTLPDVRGFPSYNENISIIKNTKVAEGATLQFRAEFFNAFNRVVFGAPDTNWNDVVTGGFGKVTSQFNAPRVIQFALRMDF